MQQKQIREYEWIGKGERISLTDSQLALLDHLTGTLPGNAIEWQRYRFRFCGYCGVLQLGDLTLEVLPKVHGTETEPGKARSLLIRMLAAVQKLDLHSTGSAHLNLQQHVLLDVFILSFAEKLQNLLRRGMVHTYIQQEENLQVVRGKIDIAQQVKNNLCHQHRVYCQYDEFLSDNLQNRIIKVTLSYLARFARSNQVQQLLEQLCGIFADVTEVFPKDSDWERLSFDRTNQEWKEILEQCRWFLSGMNPDVISGSDQSISLLFAMNILFEEYVAIELKKAFGHQYDVLAQKPQRKLLNHADGRKIFTMKPDLYVREKTSQLPTAILDTKWKLLNGDERKMGISQADLYQMYTYAGSYNVSKVMLLYPKQAGLDISDSQWRFIDDTKSLEVIQIEIEYVLKGRRFFRQYLSDLFMPKFENVEQMCHN